MNQFEIGILFALGNLAPLFTMHLLRDNLQIPMVKVTYVSLISLYFMLVFTFFVYFSQSVQIRFLYLAIATFVFAAFLFLVLSELMVSGMASALTRWRGEVWVKELDYIYLMLGCGGLAISISRLDTVSDKLALPEYVGPFVLAAALAIRAIKTRAEVNEWSKLSKSA